MPSREEALARLWHHATAAGAVPDRTTVLVTAAVAALLVLWRPSWQWLRYGVTACHEAGHALVARLTGRRLDGVRLERRSGGVTVSRGRPSGPGLVATFFAGYPSPAIAGLLACLAVHAGRPGMVLLGALVGTVVLAVVIRNALGWLVVLSLVVVLGAGLWWPEVVVVVGPGIAVFLLFAAVRDTIGLARARRRDRSTDADQLARITIFPAVVWVAVFFLVTLAAAVAGLWALLQP